MRVSRRAAAPAAPNAVAGARAELAAAGRPVLDLTDSNPTRHGLTDGAVLEAVARAATRSGAYDPDPKGPVEARAALADRFGGAPDDYWLASSTSEAYAWCFAILADPGDAVAIPAPGYPLVEPIARLADLATVPYPLHYVHPYGWIHDGERIAAAARAPGVRAVVAVSPGNPTGAYVGSEARAALVEACAATGAALIADEVFHPFALDALDSLAAPAPPPRLAGEASVPTFALDGLSKLLAAPQLKLGWLRVSGPAGALGDARAALDRIADAFLPVSAPVATALPSLLDLADAAVARVRARLAANLAAARHVLEPAGWRVRRCEGGWTAVADAPPSSLGEEADGGELAIALMRRAGLAAHPGWFYDLPDPRALALSLLPEPDAFARACRGLREAVAGQSGR